jgi:hypothetical protein
VNIWQFIWQFSRSITLLVMGLVSMGSYFSSYGDLPHYPYWKIYWGLTLVGLGIFAGALRYWRIRMQGKL